MTQPWPFVGREPELDLIHRQLTDTASGGVLLAGPAGVGKSRLVVEALSRLDGSAYAVVRVQATHSASGVPFGALATLLPAEPPGAVNLLRWAADAFLARAGDGQRLLLAVDDAHLLDAASAALLHQLALQRRTLLLATVRTGEPVPSAITALWKDEETARIDMGPLPLPVLAELLEGALGGEVAWHTVRRLGRLSQGNVVFLRELVLSALSDGALVRNYGAWILRDDPGIAPRLSELLRARLLALRPETRGTLEFLALGEPLDIGLLRRLVPAEAIEDAEEARLIAVDGGQARIVHPLYSEAIRAELPSQRRRERNRQLARAAGPPDRIDHRSRLRLATWRLAGEDDISPAEMLTAARTAAASFDLPLAARLAAAAVEAGGGVPAALTHAYVLGAAERWDEALAAAEAGRHTRADPAERAGLATVHAIVLALGHERHADALALLADVAQEVHGDAAQAELGCGRTTVEIHAGNPAAAWRSAERVLATPEAGLPPGCRAHARIMGGWALAHLGRTDQAVRFARSALADAPLWQAERPSVLPFIPVTLATAGLMSGDLALVDEALELWPRLARDGDWPMVDGLLGTAMASTHRLRGRGDLAARAAREAASRSDLTRAAALGELVQALAVLGERAAGTIVIGQARGQRVGVQGLLGRNVEAAAVALSAVAPREAAEEARRAAVALDAGGMYGAQVHVLHQLTRLGAPDPGWTEQVAARCDGPFPPLAAAHARALHQRDPQALSLLAERYADLGLSLYAAEAAAHAAGLLHRAGAPARARSAELRAWALADRCHGLHTPALSALRTPELTARERELAELVAEGLGNRMIAEQLHLAVRTVENHLASVYAKLGVSNRGELARLLG